MRLWKGTLLMTMLTLLAAKKRLLALCVVACCAIVPSTASAQLLSMPEMTPLEQMPGGTYQLDKTHASVTWKISHLGLSRYTARFTKFDAKLTMDVKDPSKSQLVASVYPMSVATDFPFVSETDFDQTLATGKEWFNADRFPEIRFVSKRIQITGKNTGKIFGELTLLGKTKPLDMNVTFNGAYRKKFLTNVPALGFSATASLQRSDWGFTTLIPIVGDRVDILIEAEFDKADP